DAKVTQWDANGNLKRMFGWDVVSNGPDNTGAKDQQAIEVPPTVTGGSFKLTLESVLGRADFHGESTAVTNVETYIGKFQAGEVASIKFAPEGTEITEVGDGTMKISAPFPFGAN